MTQNRILLCEDEENIVAFLRAELEYENFRVDVAPDGETATRLFSAGEYDCILLDVMLPEKNGLEILREIRKTHRTPVIMVTARKEVFDKVTFLNAGADDYVTKPFDTLELIARIKRNISRGAGAQTAPQGHGLYICKESYRAYFADNEIKLTKTEFEILAFLFDHAEKVKTREEIIRAVFGDFYGESNIVDANVKNIRAKLAAYTQQEVIHTVRGKGYYLTAIMR
ncbi:MAG: response regulator transcription factor [Defluviitaleaceae bacterium]|nr:response regulator transcription factor [Defluviitaleaceae bacterium]MCL2273694.1 response regulator transcription factor [Defluviitaleaceae bacterium]